jgi:uncharacterized phage-associated protein
MGFRPFDIVKAVQAVAVILRSEPDHKMGRLRLMKLLYIAHRKMLMRHGRPLLSGNIVAMKHGPLHSEVYRAVQRDGADEPVWRLHIHNDGPQDVRLAHDPGTTNLSDAEVEALNDAVEDMAGYGEWEVVDITHTFPEWLSNYPDPNEFTSRAICLEDILKAVGMGDNSAEIQAELDEQAEFNRLLNS